MRHTVLASRAALLALLAPLASAPLLGCSDDESASTEGSGASSTGASSTGASSTGASGAEGGSGPGSGGSGATASGGSGGSGGIPTTVDCSAAVGDIPALTLTEIASDLDSPILVKSAPDNLTRLYIVSRSGQILIHENGMVLPTLFLDIGSLVLAGGEQGLLGLAFHPDYASNGRFFVHYSASDSGGDTTIMEYHRSDGDPLVADPSPVQLVLQHDTAQPNHNGGSIEFGPDGFLYIAIGDGGTQEDPGCDAKNPDNLLGKITRLDVNASPDGNGYPAAPGNPGGNKWYHIGLRNPWRMSFDPCTGDLYIGDVGSGSWEEADVVTQAQGAVDFGWPIREGAHDLGGYDGTCEDQGLPIVEPIGEHSHSQGDSIIGGYVYRGSAIPGLRGTYFWSDNGSGRVWTTAYSGGTATPQVELNALDQGLSVSSFGQDGTGEMYVVNLGGTVYRIDAQ